MWIIAVGDPLDVLSLYGPFQTCEDAVEWAEREVANAGWSAVELNEPNVERHEPI